MKKNIFIFVIFLLFCISKFAIAIPQNLALNADTLATADDFYTGPDAGPWLGSRNPSQAIDGDRTWTNWTASSHGTSEAPHWLLINLGSVFSVNEIKLFTDNNVDGKYEGFYVAYNLYISIDNVNWRQLVSNGRLVDTANSDDYMNTVTLNGESLQYVKYEVIGGNHWAHLFELEIWGEPQIITVTTDIKPGDCPNTLNLTSQGILPVAILGNEELDVNAIDLASIQLAGISPIRSNSVEDVSTSIIDKQDKCDCTTEREDGFDDLTLKFSTKEILTALGKVSDGEVLILTLTGALKDGTSIEGEDCIMLFSSKRDNLAKSQSMVNY